MIDYDAPSRLMLDGAALVHNWRWLAAQSGAAACGAAIKADGYGLGARDVMDRLAAVGCRDFFVASWAEAAALMPLPPGCTLAVLHGVREADMAIAANIPAKPVLNTAEQVARWRASFASRPCDIMIDTGMNRLGLAPSDYATLRLSDLRVDVVMSHLAHADEDSPRNAAQRDLLISLKQERPGPRYSLANSAGIMLGASYHFDLTRPGLALYGGIARDEMASGIRPVVALQAQVLQRRIVRQGDGIGYNGTWHAPADMPVLIVNLGYADGYLRSFSARDGQQGGSAEQGRLPVIGRVSMDLVALDARAAPDLGEGAWISMDYHLATASRQSGLSPYELLTLLGSRHQRIWND